MMYISMLLFAFAAIVAVVAVGNIGTASNECSEKGQISVSFHGSVAEGLGSLHSNIWYPLTGGKGSIFYVSVSDLMGAQEDQIQALVRLQSQSGRYKGNMTMPYFDLGLDLDPLGDDINDYSEEELVQLLKLAESRVGLKFQFVRLPWRSFSHRVLRLFQETLALIVTESSNAKDSSDLGTEEALIDTFQDFRNGSVYLVFDSGRLLSQPFNNRVILQTLLSVNIESSNLERVSSQHCLTGDASSTISDTEDEEQNDKKLDLIRSIAYSVGLTITLSASVISFFRLSKIQ